MLISVATRCTGKNRPLDEGEVAWFEHLEEQERARQQAIRNEEAAALARLETAQKQAALDDHAGASSSGADGSGSLAGRRPRPAARKRAAVRPAPLPQRRADSSTAAVEERSDAHRHSRTAAHVGGEDAGAALVDTGATGGSAQAQQPHGSGHDRLHGHSNSQLVAAKPALQGLLPGYAESGSSDDEET